MTSSGTVASNGAMFAVRLLNEGLSSTSAMQPSVTPLDSSKRSRSPPIAGDAEYTGLGGRHVDTSDISQSLFMHNLPDVPSKLNPIRSKILRPLWVTRSQGSPVERSRKTSQTCTRMWSGQAIAAVCSVRNMGDTSTTVGFGPLVSSSFWRAASAWARPASARLGSVKSSSRNASKRAASRCTSYAASPLESPRDCASADALALTSSSTTLCNALPCLTK
mmetsp:Transcript_33825/g.97220  ORF Transcript_33825/g.97220 Transcript_33825/m.97220 type:complete len:220 (-) Transcript_33825:229-888(-)